ncbi:MAG: dihydropteroate synthase [Pirellulales bacterium]|nr:dihydropteroate synthase [Pirellulales bacterium]
MGVINVTPDSFSDGGKYFEPAAAVEHGIQLAGQGADLLDVGGQSTRPGATPIDAEEELCRVLPVIEALCKQTSLPVSIDTFQPTMAEAALDAGAEIINDITALRNPAMLRLAACSGCGVCAMHIQGTPQTMQEHPTYQDVVAEVFQFLTERRETLIQEGIAAERIALDPGIGFGKTVAHNLDLLRNARRFHTLGSPLLVGPSRKQFIGQVIGDPTADRLPGTIGVALALARQRIQILRVHDVAAIRQALLLFETTGGIEK